MNRIKKIRAVSLIFVIVISFFLIPLNLYNLNNDYSQPNMKPDFIHSSAETVYNQEWLDNNGFSTQDEWFYNQGAQGDNSTTDANISGGSANYIVVGEDSSFSLTAGEVNSSSWDGWGVYNNSDFLLPDIFDINSTGCYVYHRLDESEGPTNEGQVHNFPSIHFRKNVSLPNDMSDYEITSASLDVLYNATVDYTVDTPLDIYNTNEITDPPGFAIGDSATFYVEISDLARTYSFRVAENKTKYLGQWNSSGAYPSILNITDRLLETVSEEDLITALNLALEKDIGHTDFTITVGIDIYCEDNNGSPGDIDQWDALIIKSYNLTLGYKRKVDQFSSISWNQIGNTLSGGGIQITDANLEFRYKIDQDWPTALSPFSEIRIIINNNQHPETIRLSSATTSWQDAKIGGFDVTNLILKDTNISVSLQVFIANTFSLTNNITISIDDVYLNITYVETFPDYGTESQLFLESSNKTADPFIQIPLGHTVNITIKYLDNQTGNHIAGANVQLSGKVSGQLNENGPLEQYSRIIDSTDLEIGIWSLTVTAQKPNYETQIIPFFVDVVERPTDFQLYVDGFHKTINNTMNIKYNEAMNITIFYRDGLSNQHISGANVSITDFGNLDDINEQYNITINTNSLNLGFNVLTITANLENYTSQTLQLYVEVYDRTTDFKLLVNDIEKVENDLIQIQVGGILNLTIFYTDTLFQNHLSGAIAKLVGTGNFSEIGSQYNYSLDSMDLNIGFNILSISTQLDNYEPHNIQIYIEVYTIPSELTLLVDSASTSPNEIVQVKVDEFINITVFYKDNETKQYLTGATVELIGWGNFSEIGKQYNFTVDTNDLSQGITVLTITAQFGEYQSQNIQFYVEIIEKATELILYVEGEEKLEKDTVQANINQFLNLTIFYQENLTEQHLSGASVNFIGMGSFTEIGTQYYYNLNTTDLGLGINAITISVQLEEYQSQKIQIFVEIFKKATELKLEVESEEKSEKDTVQVIINQMVNLTIFYQENFTKQYLSGAVVNITGIGTFTEVGTQYYFNLNTTDLGIGFNVITISAQLDDYQSQNIQIYVEIFEKATELKLEVESEEKLEKDTVQVIINQLLNLTIFYKENLTEQHLSGASVNLVGRGSFTEVGTQYYYNLNTSDLGVGFTVITISAQLDDYQSQNLQIYIEVVEKATELKLYVEGGEKVEKDTVQVIINQFINLTIFYHDNVSSVHLSGANVTLIGVGNFNDIGTQYYYNLNSTVLGLGFNVITISVQLDDFQSQNIQIYIEVVEQATELFLYVEGEEKVEKDIVQIEFNQLLNLTIFYHDNVSSTHLSGANVTLTGVGDFNDIGTQYYYNLNTTVLGLGFNVITISVQLNEYQSQNIQIYVDVYEIPTELQLFLNGVPYSARDTLEVEVNEFINISILYRDNSTWQFLNNATVELLGWGNFSEIGAQYNFTISTNDLEQGITILTINAQYTNYLSQNIQFYVKVIERATDFRFYVEGTLINETDTLSVEVNQFLNFTVFYQDNLTKQHLSGATIALLSVGNFSDVGVQYYYLLNTNDLEQGITILTVFVYLENYQPKTFQFYVKVSERASEISLFLNSEESTTDPVYELPFGSILNVTVKYLDNLTKIHISGSNIQLIGDIYFINLTENLAMSQYTLLLDTTVLKIGVNLFTIIAYANNFQVKTLTIRITLNKIATVINTTSGESYFSILPSESVLLSIELSDSDFGGTITDATVTYQWAYGQGTLLDPENDGTYEIELENIPTGTYIITITASAGDDYNFETYEITINVVSVAPDDFSLLFIALAGALVAMVLGITLYVVRFKYPPTVRKSRKLRKKIRKGKKTKPIKDIISREDIIKDRLESNADIIQLEKKTENGLKEK